MAQPATILDPPASETVKHGSQVITFSTAGALVTEEITYSKGSRAIDQMDETGKPSKSAYVATKGTGTMVVQCKATTTRITFGETGTFLDTNGSTTISFIVTEVGPRYTQGDATKINISIAEKLN